MTGNELEAQSEPTAETGLERNPDLMWSLLCRALCPLPAAGRGPLEGDLQEATGSNAEKTWNVECQLQRSHIQTEPGGKQPSKGNWASLLGGGRSLVC